jgi:hypothetical protein
MLNIDLSPRPWSGHHPKHGNYSPLIKADIERVSFSRKTGWRCKILIDDAPICISHHHTKSWAEHEGARMLKIYTEVHYISK